MTIPAECDAILFDLDGTLSDPKVGIVKSLRYALSKFGITDESDETLVSFIGAPLYLFLQEQYSMNEEQAQRAMEFYREYYSETGIYENTVYPGIPDLLKRLRDGGKTLCVATLKPVVFAERVLEYFELRPCFDHVAGPDLRPEGLTKTEIIGQALASMKNIPTDKTVMIGDREHDVIGARQNGIASIAVAYGYGSMEELQSAGPDHMAASVEELARLLDQTG